MRRGLLLAVALGAALVAFPSPERLARPPARSLALWGGAAPAAEVLRALAGAGPVTEVRMRPGGDVAAVARTGASVAADAARGDTSADTTGTATLAATLVELEGPGGRRLDVDARGWTGGEVEALSTALAARVDGRGERWLVAWVPADPPLRGSRSASAPGPRAWIVDTGAGRAARSLLGTRCALTVGDLSAWLGVHAGGAGADARDRWPTAILAGPVLSGSELVWNGPPAEPWGPATPPPGWDGTPSELGRLADGAPCIAGVEGALVLRQVLPLPQPAGSDGLAVTFEVRLGPTSHGAAVLTAGERFRLTLRGGERRTAVLTEPAATMELELEVTGQPRAEVALVSVVATRAVPNGAAGGGR